MTMTAVTRVLTHPDEANGRLPFDLPRDMSSVTANASDAPYDLDDPLFRHALWTSTSTSTSTGTTAEGHG